MRLAHKVLLPTARLSDGCIDDPRGFAEEARTEIGCISRSPIIVADNVAEFYAGHQNSSASGDGWKGDDFPNCAPPFPTFFIEYACPFDTARGQVGWFFIDLDEDHVANFCEQYDVEDCEKVVLASAWGVVKGTAVYCGIKNLLFLDSRGAVVFSKIFGFATDSELERWTIALHPALLAISFMHCKNVSREDQTEAAGPTKKWLKRQKQPELRYYTLQINPMKEVLRKDGNCEVNGLKKALHICRGHFATYSEDKPLFGRIAGTVWRPSHVRGSADHGTVVKDYEIGNQNGSRN